MPNDPICHALLALLDRPVLCTSVRVPADSGSKWCAATDRWRAFPCSFGTPSPCNVSRAMCPRIGTGSPSPHRFLTSMLPSASTLSSTVSERTYEKPRSSLSCQLLHSVPSPTAPRLYSSTRRRRPHLDAVHRPRPLFRGAKGPPPGIRRQARRNALSRLASTCAFSSLYAKGSQASKLSVWAPRVHSPQLCVGPRGGRGPTRGPSDGGARHRVRERRLRLKRLISQENLCVTRNLLALYIAISAASFVRARRGSILCTVIGWYSGRYEQVCGALCEMEKERRQWTLQACVFRLLLCLADKTRGATACCLATLCCSLPFFRARAVGGCCCQGRMMHDTEADGTREAQLSINATFA